MNVFVGMNPEPNTFPDGKAFGETTINNQPSRVPGLKTELLVRFFRTCVLSLHEVVKTDEKGKYYVDEMDANNTIRRGKEKTVFSPVAKLNRSAAQMDNSTPKDLIGQNLTVL